MKNDKNVKMVETVDGSLQPLSDCRKMKGIYYLKGDVNIKDSGQCYFLEDQNKYYKYNTGFIEYDYNLNTYVLKSKIDIEKGVVAINGDNVIFGAFSLPLFYKPIFLKYKNTTYNCISRNIFKDSFYFKEDLTTGIYYERTVINSINFVKPKPCDNNYKNSLPYNCGGVLKNAINDYNLINENFVHDYTQISKLSSYFHNYTFGFEFESVAGFIPEDICSKIGLIPVRDGSIKGLEYVTIPLKGEKGLVSLLDSLKELKKRTNYDDSCSLHLHLGGIPRTESYILALFKMLCLLENKIFELFPLYKKENLGIKRKAYTKPFPFEKTLLLMDSKIDSKDKIRENFGILFKYLSMGQDYKNYDYNLNKVTSHPSDPGNNGKWNIKTRYHHINLIPIIFGNKETVEFRIHTPTYDEDKIINYLLICVSILEFVKKYEKDILNNIGDFSNITLFDVTHHNVNESKHLSSDISNYLDKRKNYIYNCVKNGDILADEDKFFYTNRYVKWSSTSKNDNLKIEREPFTFDYNLDNIGQQYFAEINNGNNIQYVDPIGIIGHDEEFDDEEFDDEDDMEWMNEEQLAELDED